MREFPFKKLRIINYLLILSILLSAILFARDIIRIKFSKKVHLTAGTKKETKITFTKIKDIKSYSPILEQNPFGPSMKLIPLVTEHKIKVHGPLSEFILVGTVTGPKNLSYAIFENKSRTGTPEQEIFAHGVNVYDYGRLTKIKKEWVELTQGANAFKIYIIDPQIKVLETQSTKVLQTTFVKKLGKNQYMLDQRKVQQALDNPEQILTDARLLPNIKNRKQKGFSISEVRPGGLYESLGLRNGDILLRVNNLEISNPEVAIQAMTALRGMNTVNLDIIRNGAKLTLSYQIR